MEQRVKRVRNSIKRRPSGVDLLAAVMSSEALPPSSSSSSPSLDDLASDSNTPTDSIKSLRFQLNESHALIQVLSSDVLSTHAADDTTSQDLKSSLTRCKELTATNEQLRKELFQISTERDALEESNDVLEAALEKGRSAAEVHKEEKKMTAKENSCIQDIKISLQETNQKLQASNKRAEELTAESNRWKISVAEITLSHTHAMEKRESEYQKIIEKMRQNQKKVLAKEQKAREIAEKRESKREQNIESAWFLEAQRLQEEVNTLRGQSKEAIQNELKMAGERALLKQEEALLEQEVLLRKTVEKEEIKRLQIEDECAQYKAEIDTMLKAKQKAQQHEKDATAEVHSWQSKFTLLEKESTKLEVQIKEITTKGKNDLKRVETQLVFVTDSMSDVVHQLAAAIESKKNLEAQLKQSVKDISEKSVGFEDLLGRCRKELSEVHKQLNNTIVERDEAIASLHHMQGEAAADLLLQAADSASDTADYKSKIVESQKETSTYIELLKEKKYELASVTEELKSLKELLSDDALERQAQSAMELVVSRNALESLKEEYARAQHVHEKRAEDLKMLEEKYLSLSLKSTVITSKGSNTRPHESKAVTEIVHRRPDILTLVKDNEDERDSEVASATKAGTHSPQVKSLVGLERSLPPTPIQDEGEGEDEEDTVEHGNITDYEEDENRTPERQQSTSQDSWDSKVVNILLGGTTPIQDDEEDWEGEEEKEEDVQQPHQPPQPLHPPAPYFQPVPLSIPPHIMLLHRHGQADGVSTTPMSSVAGTNSTFDGTPIHASDALDNMTINSPLSTPIPSSPPVRYTEPPLPPSSFFPDTPSAIITTSNSATTTAPTKQDDAKDIRASSTTDINAQPISALTTLSNPFDTAIPIHVPAGVKKDDYSFNSENKAEGKIGAATAAATVAFAIHNISPGDNSTSPRDLSFMELSKIDHQQGNEMTYDEDQPHASPTSPVIASPALSLSSLYSPSDGGISSSSAVTTTKLFVDIDTDIGTTETIGVSSYKDLDDCMVLFSRKYGLTDEARSSLREYLGDLLAQHLSIEGESKVAMGKR
jgi:hypothetical protein